MSSVRDDSINEIKLAPEFLVQEAYEFVSSAKPDFLARQQVLFGIRVLPDSQGLMDELRAERF